MSSNLTEEEFSKHVGTSFNIEAGDRVIELKLVEVQGYLPKENEQRGMERFSLLFNGPSDLMVHQQTVPLKHEHMGEVYLFLVPISRDEKGIRYEAVFNYYRDKE